MISIISTLRTHWTSRTKPVFYPLRMSAEPLELPEDGERAIRILALSIWGVENAPLTENSGVHIRPQAVAEGTNSTVSAGLAAEMTSFGLERLLSWAASGNYFCKVDWAFRESPNSPSSPDFSTRHLLTREETAVIAFSGGLGWASNLLALLQRPHLAPSVGRQTAQNPGRERIGNQSPQKHSHHNPDSPLPAPNQRKTRSAARRQSLQDRRDRHLLHSSNPLPFHSNTITQNTQITRVTTPTTRHFPDWGCDEYSDTDQPESPEPLTTATTRENTPCSESGSQPYRDPVDEQIQRQMQINIFERRQREAEDLYTRTGDSSGLFDVLRAAPQHSSLWQPSGRPYF